MNFTKLVLHGLSAIAIYADVVLVRALIMAMSLVILTVTGAVIVLAIKLFTNLAIPGWATYVLGMLLVIFIQAVALCFVSVFLSLNRKLMSTDSSRSVMAKVIDTGTTEVQ